MFKMRTTPVEVGTKPYAWGVDSQYECTWYCFFRALECNMTECEYWDRPTKTGSYTDAKLWLENYRDPWQVKDRAYKPVAGDIAVFDGELGHVIFIESVDDDCVCTEYRSGDPNSFRLFHWKYGTDYTGALLGYIHFPYSPVEPVARNESIDQIETTDDTLRIRTKPSLNGDVVGYVGVGYYNVLSTQDADGYTWYEIAKNRYCANITTVYLPADGGDIIRQIEDYFNSLKRQASTLKSENDSLKKDMKKIGDITKKWGA